MSAQNVGQASELIHEYSQDITRAIGEINEGMEEQSDMHRSAWRRPISSPMRIQEVSHVVERVEKLVRRDGRHDQQGNGDRTGTG